MNSSDLSKSKKIRAIGWSLIILGPGISAAMALAARALSGTIAFDALAGRQPHWRGSPGFTRMALELFGAVFLLGAFIFLGGIYQVRTGRRSPMLIVIVLGLAVVSAYLTYRVASSR